MRRLGGSGGLTELGADPASRTDVANLKHLDKSKPFVDKDSMQKMILEHGGDYGQRIPDNVDSRVVIASE